MPRPGNSGCRPARSSRTPRWGFRRHESRPLRSARLRRCGDTSRRLRTGKAFRRSDCRPGWRRSPCTRQPLRAARRSSRPSASRLFLQSCQVPQKGAGDSEFSAGERFPRWRRRKGQAAVGGGLRSDGRRVRQMKRRASAMACDALVSFLVGGVTRDFDSNFRIGRGPHFVVEGDEYDTAYFDKGPKFLHYRPRTAIFTSCELDHADIYRDEAHYQQAFERFVELLPPDGFLAACAGYPSVRRIAALARCPVETYSAE